MKKEHEEALLGHTEAAAAAHNEALAALQKEKEAEIMEAKKLHEAATEEREVLAEP